MQNEAKAALKRMLVQSIHIDIKSAELLERQREKKELIFDASGKSELQLPKDEGDNTFLLLSTSEITARENPKLFNAAIDAEFYFELDSVPQDLDLIIRKQCLPIIQQETLDLANKMLDNMGYRKFLRNRE